LAKQRDILKVELQYRTSINDPEISKKAREAEKNKRKMLL
jgi:hypothetical protein